MNANWCETNAIKLAAMKEVSDEIIRSESNGVVPVDNRDADIALADATIFGNLPFHEGEKENMLLGHFELPVKVVNTEYLLGKNSFLLENISGISRKEMKNIIYSVYYVVTDAKDDTYTVGNIVSYKDYHEFENKIDGLTGAEGLLFLLRKKNVPEELISKVILTTIPIMPVIMRYTETECDGDIVFKPNGLQRLYEYLYNAISRYLSLSKIPLPEIIAVNEYVHLQRRVDFLINNGANGKPVMNGWFPCMSLSELYSFTTSFVCGFSKTSLTKDDILFVKETADKAYQEYSDFNNSLPQEPIDGDDPDMLGHCLTDEEEQELDRLENNIKEAMLPVVESVIEKDFAAYKDGYKDRMIEQGSMFIKDSIEAYLDDADLMYFAYGVFAYINAFVQKQLSFS